MENQNRPIVVGTDGSDFSNLALRKALWLGRQVKAKVKVVRAWSISTTPRPKSWSMGYVPPVDDFAEVVRERLERDVSPVLAEFPEVEVELLTPHCAPGRELLRIAQDALLVVVGTRGLGGFRGLKMGSVSNQVVEHAPCDVLVVRKGTAEASPDRRRPLDQVLDE